MTKKSLFLGAAALALLVLFAFIGCSNPSSGDSAPVSQAGAFGAIPDGAVYTDDLVELEGLLNDFRADTNQVSDIVFTQNAAALIRDITIPTGKTVYLTNATNSGVALGTLVSNIIVEEGGRLVLLADLITDGATKRLLVKGQLDIYEALTTTALDVADYFFEASGTIDAKGTVIGTGHVVVHTGATLIITDDDIAPEPSPDRFTPAQAWAAAGQGSLVIVGALDTNYKVTDVIAGVYPSRDRFYVVETNGGGVLPSVIPAGAIITANGVIEDAEGHNLTVNGSLTAENLASTFEDIVTLTVNGTLIANSATFENVEKLTVSSANTDNLASRASTPTDSDVWIRSYLGADSATLEKAADITIGDNGEFESESTAIVLPEGAKIRLGRSAVFTSAGLNTNSFDNLTSLFIGPAAAVTIRSPAVTFKSLETLTLQDSAQLDADAGAAVSFLVDTATPPARKTIITLGKNVLYQVGVSPTAKVDVAIKNDSSLIAGSVVAVNPGSTFTLDPGVTLTVPTGAAVDFSAVTTGSTAGPATPADAPIKINGTIEVTGSGSIIGPSPVGLTNATDVYKFTAFEDGGKVLLNYGTSFTTGATKLVGADGTGSAYEWVSGGTSDGAQIEINGEGLVIRDTDGNGAEVTIGAPNAYILKEQTLTLEAGVELLVDSAANRLWLAGDAATSGGATLKGPGKLIAGTTEISGGSRGWQVFGGDTIGISYTGATAATIANSGTGATTFTALGAGATITQAASGTLTIGPNTTIELGGSSSTAWGVIVLKDSGGALEFNAATSKLLLGAGSGGAAASGLTTLKIGGKDVTNTSLVAADYQQADGVLVQIGGTTAGSIAANAGDITIASNAAFVGTTP
ncbi:hypothetical protein LQZ21_12015 [Treponema sp. TIM-1]|uniref:hypothetical protein n=1 Tax=Treponema sp. TIM-1 TaxID=2898417 RepID=UPI00398079B2